MTAAVLVADSLLRVRANLSPGCFVKGRGVPLLAAASSRVQ